MAPTIALGCISMSSHVGASLLWLLLIYWFSEQFHLPLGAPGTLEDLLDTLFFFRGGGWVRCSKGLSSDLTL